MNPILNTSEQERDDADSDQGQPKVSWAIWISDGNGFCFGLHIVEELKNGKSKANHREGSACPGHKGAFCGHRGSFEGIGGSIQSKHIRIFFIFCHIIHDLS